MSQEKEYGIALKLNATCSAEAISLNKICAEAWPNLENPSNTWHITLYHGAYKDSDLWDICSKINALNTQHITLNFSTIYNTANRWVDWKIDKTEELALLHHKVVDIASPYHQLPLERSKDVYDSLSTPQKAQVDKYGVSGILDLYNPHTTLFYQYPPDTILNDITEILPAEIIMSYYPESLILGELGYNGNITSVLYES